MTISSDAVRISAPRRVGPAEHTRPAERPVKRILVVDDSAPMRAMLRSMLLTDNATCWEMVEAVSGADFLELISSQAAFDAVLLDVQMPGMDGFTACRLFREQHRRTPVVFLTAEGDRGSFDQGRASGGDSYLAKPFSPAALKTVLHVLTDLRRCADGSTAAP
jgi:two-component system alkaline phosphatase synthesis response regulator PhoP